MEQGSTESQDEKEVDRTAIFAHLQAKYGKEPTGTWTAAVGTAITGGAVDQAMYYSQNNERPHWDIVSYGLNTLGYEFVLRLPWNEGEAAPSQWPVRLFETVGREALAGMRLQFYDSLETGPLDADTENKFAGVLVLTDPFLDSVDTPSGDMSFLEMIPLLPEELAKVKEWSKSIQDEDTFNAYKEKVDALLAEIAETQTKLLITDLNRGN